MNMSVRKVYALQNKLYCAAKQSLDRKFGALYDKIYRKDVLFEAWRRVRANKGGPGIDQQTLDAIEERGVEALLDEVERKLRQFSYRPLAVKRVWIEKPGKKERRPLGIPAVIDRVVQMAAKLILEPIFETNFLPCSYGSRPKRDPAMALREIQRTITFRGKTRVIEVDIKGYFTNIQQEKLMNLIERRISDPRVLKLLKSWLRAGILDQGEYFASDDNGIPQGGVISPLMSNIYLHSFDKMWAQSGIPGTLVRYVDDFVVLINPWQDADWVLDQIKAMLNRLGLETHPEKTGIVDAKEGFDFLGIHLRLCKVTKPNPKIAFSCRLWPSDRSVSRLKEKVRKVVGRRYGLSLEQLIKELNPVLRGWYNYQVRARPPEKKRFKALNRYIRNRVRIFLKRKYSDETMGAKRIRDNLLVRLGLFQLA